VKHVEILINRVYGFVQRVRVYRRREYPIAFQLRVAVKSRVVDYCPGRFKKFIVPIFKCRVPAVFIPQGLIVILTRLFFLLDGRGVLVYLLPAFLGRFGEVLESLL